MIFFIRNDNSAPSYAAVLPGAPKIRRWVRLFWRRFCYAAPSLIFLQICEKRASDAHCPLFVKLFSPAVH
jgi:hypothetical protein